MMTELQQQQYANAKLRVHKLKGFYKHLLIYLIINGVFAYLNYTNLKPGESYFQYNNFITLFFWGIGLTAHALSVFVPTYFFGTKWEEKKIKELMNKKEQTAKWE